MMQWTTRMVAELNWERTPGWLHCLKRCIVHCFLLLPLGKSSLSPSERQIPRPEEKNSPMRAVPLGDAEPHSLEGYPPI